MSNPHGRRHMSRSSSASILSFSSPTAARSIPATRWSLRPAQAKWLELPRAEVKGYGVSACATCERLLLCRQAGDRRRRRNTAVEESLYLARGQQGDFGAPARFAARRAHPQERCSHNPRIEWCGTSTIEEIFGGDDPPGVTHCGCAISRPDRLEDVATDGGLRRRSVHQPASISSSVRSTIRPNGYIKTAPFSTATNIPASMRRAT